MASTQNPEVCQYSASEVEGARFAMSREDIAASNPDTGDGSRAFTAGGAIRMTMRHAQGYLAPPDGLEPPTPTTLDWYAEAS